MLTEYLKVQMPYEELQNQSAGIYILAYTKSSLKNDEIDFGRSLRCQWGKFLHGKRIAVRKTEA